MFRKQRFDLDYAGFVANKLLDETHYIEETGTLKNPIELEFGDINESEAVG